MCIICNQGFFDSTMLKQTSVLPFKNIKSCFFNNRRMKGRATVRGGGRAGGPFPQKILKSWCSETSFLVFIIHIFIFELSRTSSRLYFIIRAVFGFWIYYVWCHWMGIIRIHLKIWEQISTSGFLLSRSHFGQDSGFSIKIGRIPTRSGWLDSLHRRITFYGIVKR